MYDESIQPIIDAYNEAAEILGEFKANISNMDIAVLKRALEDWVEDRKQTQIFLANPAGI